METFRSHDGLPITARLEAGDPRIVYAHATGFCKEVWGPVTGLLPGRGVLAIDQRGHGGSGVGSPPFDWWDLGRDVVTAVRAAGWDRPLGVGHSSGAAALVMAELLRPGSFRALLLIEPIVFPPPYVRYEHLPLALKAERRRASFPSRDAARASFEGRGPFEGWVGEALDAYLDGGFGDRDGGWALNCAPEVEAEWYRAATTHGAWDRLGEITCPAVVVGGTESDSHPAAFLEELAGRLEDATVAMVEGAGHFVPMQRPEVVAGMIAELTERPDRGHHPAG